MASKTVWEARSRDEWETEKAFYDISSPMTTFGELVTAKQQPGDALNARKIDTWEAGVDKLGIMMNIAVGLTGHK